MGKRRGVFSRHSRVRWAAWIIFGVVTCAVGLSASGGTAAAAEPGPELLTRVCEGRFTDIPPFLRPEGASECFAPGAVAVDQASGDIYVAESANARVSHFTAWGAFVGAWGWGVRDGADELQTCTTGTGCQTGIAGAGPGQFADGSHLDLAVDSTGDVYVVDQGNRRIEEFTPQGGFVLMFGGGVDQGGGTPSNPGDLCTAEDLSHGDVCEAGTDGSGPGEFSAEAPGTLISVAIDTRGTASAADDLIYVGDANRRIQKFDTGGGFLDEIVPAIAGVVGAIAVDSSPASSNFGDLYVSEPNVVEGAASLPDVYRLDANSGSALSTLQNPRPVAIAVEGGGAVDVLNWHEPGSSIFRVIRFEPDGSQAGVFFEDELSGATKRSPLMTLAASSACGLSGSDLIIPSLQAASLDETIYSVGIYGPPPNPAICPPPAVAPTVTDQYATTVGVNEATVQARVNPHFWTDTKLYVEYGTGPCRSGGCTARAGFPGQALGDRVTNSPVAGPAHGIVLGEGGGLRPDTTYFFRVVAQSSGGGPVFGVAPQDGEASESEGLEGTFHTFAAPPAPKTDCPNQVLRSGASAHLPDCRAYELVSPADNGGGIGPPAESHDLSSLDGNAVTFATLVAGFGEPASTPFAPQYVASRNASLGWETQAIDPPRALPSLRKVQDVYFLYKAFSPDLCEGWLEQDTEVALAAGQPSGVPNLYRRSGLHEGCAASSGYELLTTAPPPGFGVDTEPEEPRYFPEVQGKSADGSVTVIRANAKLTADASPADIYQVYAVQGGVFHLVSVLPNGEPSATHSSAGTAQVISGGDIKGASLDDAISEDGERIFWTACHGGKPGECEGTTRTGGGGCQGTPVECQLGSLYVRLHPLQPQSKVAAGRCTQPAKACTYLVSGEPETRFLGATASGSGVLYLAGEELFERNVNELISGGPGAAPTSIADGVSGIMGFSRDLSHIYLESNEVCGTNPGANGSHAASGSPNLYLYEPGETCGAESLDYIATLGAAEAEVGASATNVIGNAPIHLVPSARTSRVTPDGRVAIFTSSQPLTGLASADVASGKADAQVFRFDAGRGSDGELVCVSCSPTGAAPSGQNVGFGAESWVAGTIPGWIDQLHAGNPLSESGNRVFFESFSRLTPGDTNAQRDVYEWEAAGGEAQCVGEIGGEVWVPATGGCLSLISDGEGKQASFFLDASTDGRDAFIVTSASLVPQDSGFRDIYDAREFGGFPSPSSPPPACENDGCRQAGAPPSSAVPGSQVAGPGNPPVQRKRCKKKHRAKGRQKGKTKQRGSCRSPKPHKHSKHKKSQSHRSGAGGRGARGTSGKGGAK